jgi:LytS/YehU family sensor histidine kinase
MMPRAKQLLQIVGVNTIAALAVPAFVWGFSVHVSFANLLATFKYSFVYSQIIGGLAHLVIGWCWCFLLPLKPLLRWLALAPLLILIAVTGCLLAGLLLLGFGWIPSSEYWTVFLGSLKIAMVITLIVGSVTSMGEVMRGRLAQTSLALSAKELERERALKLAAEARLSSLESRVHPHFLFNTLNSISSLIQEDPARADRLVERMAALLRSSLDAHNVVRLADEMKIVADYLEIEKARFGERLQYEICVPEELAQVRIPPFSLQTLVENSVKYAVSGNRSGGSIRVTGERDNSSVRLAVADSGPGFDLAQVPSGHGIDNLRSRLAAIFGDDAQLHTAYLEGRHAISVVIPYDENHNDSRIPR